MDKVSFSLCDYITLERLLQNAVNADPCNPDYKLLLKKVQHNKQYEENLLGLKSGVMNI